MGGVKKLESLWGIWKVVVSVEAGNGSFNGKITGPNTLASMTQGVVRGRSFGW